MGTETEQEANPTVEPIGIPLGHPKSANEKSARGEKDDTLKSTTSVCPVEMTVENPGGKKTLEMEVKGVGFAPPMLEEGETKKLGDSERRDGVDLDLARRA